MAGLLAVCLAWTAPLSARAQEPEQKTVRRADKLTYENKRAKKAKQ